ncbi:MAG: hypothetical protein ACLRPR_03920 [Eisenbergiella sp.]
MVTLANSGAWLINGVELILDEAGAQEAVKAALGRSIEKKKRRSRLSRTVFWKS